MLLLQPILIQDLSLVNSSDDSIENGNDSKRILRIQDKDKNTLVLLASSVSDCSLWLKEIDNAKRAYHNMRSPMLNRPKSSKFNFFQHKILFCIFIMRLFLFLLLFHCVVNELMLLRS